MIIKNFTELATSPLRKQALLIAEAGFSAIQTSDVIRKTVKYNPRKNQLAVAGRKFLLSNYQKLICVGFGKVAFDALAELRTILGNKITQGYCIDLKTGDLGSRIVSKLGTHPYPSRANVEASQELLKMMQTATENDLIICVVGGGGSSLLSLSNDISWQTENLVTKALMDQGATIQELNTVRKHISCVKGGHLAKAMYPATVIGLIFSDVPGDDLSIVASGPTVKDSTTMHDAAMVLKKYNVLELCQMPSCNIGETPKEDIYFEKVFNVLAVSPKVAVGAMKTKAQDLGWKVKIFSEQYQGEARELGRQIVEINAPRECLLGAGESTVKIIGNGMGGRNQEMALGALCLWIKKDFSSKPDQVLACFASDGHDSSEAAGAIVDHASVKKAKRLGLEAQVYLENNDSFHFFRQTGEHVHTGLTGSNVSDFFVCLKQ